MEDLIEKLSGTVLVIDDNHADFVTLKAVVNGMDVSQVFPNGIEVCFAYDIQQALDALKSKNFDAILLDLFLPGVVETEGLKKIIAAYPSTPVIIYSGHYDRDMVRKFITAGASDYLVKDCVTEKDLIERIYIAVLRNKRDRSLDHLQMD